MDAEVAAPPLVQGRVELIEDGVIHGWAWCPSNPAERVELEALLDGRPVGTVVADLERPSLAEAGYGDGAYVFRMALPALEGPPGLHVLCVQRGSSPLLPAAGFTVQATAQGPWDGHRFRVEFGEPSAGQPPLEGRVEVIGADAVEGWAWIPEMPSDRVPLTVWIDDEEVARTVAELPRPSLAAAGIGDGAHAFRLALPQAFAHPGERRVRVESGGEPLPPAAGLEIARVERSDDPWYGARFVLDTTPTGPAAPSGPAPSGPAPALPVLGSGGWLFDGALVRAEADATRIAHLESQVAALLERLELLSEHLGELGVRLLPVLQPAKEHIYAERLPPWGEASVAIRPGDLIQRGLFGHPTLEALDLWAALRAGAEDWPVYAPLRPELSDWGTYCAYRGITKRLTALLPGVPPPEELEADAVTAVEAQRTRREAVTLRGGHTVVETVELTGVPDEPVIAGPPRAPELSNPEHVARLKSRLAIGWEQSERRELARALVVGRAQDAALAAWLARHLRFTVLVGPDAPLVDLVTLERPDAIVYLIDEAELLLPPAGEADPSRAEPELDVVAGSQIPIATEPRAQPRAFAATVDPPPGVCGFCGSRERADFSGRAGVLCLGCGSLERHRALLRTMGAEVMNGAGRTAIEIAPLNEIVSGATLRDWGWQYTGIDQSRTGSAHDPRQIGFIDYEADVRRLDRIADQAVELIVLQCVLEEVAEVDAALAELARVLAPSGRAFLEIPFSPRIPTSVTQPPDHFGDVWKFGADLPDRVRRHFPAVDVVGQEEGEYFGRVCVCRGSA